MASINRRQLIRYLLFALTLCVARGMRELQVPNVFPIPTIIGSIQTVLYVGLLALWCGSVRRRLVQPKNRIMFECIGGLMIFWQLTKGIKYHVVAWVDCAPWVSRYLWYLYYLPLLLIPALLIMIAHTLRKPEGYRLPKKSVVTLISVPLILFFCVITNDLHQLVFCFPADAVVYTADEYSRGILYYLCFAWIIGVSLTFFAVTFKSCRLPNKKFLHLPIVPITICILYSIVYILGNCVWITIDFTTMFTFSLVAVFETAILVGLIPSNNHYEALFCASDRSGIITDVNLSVVYASKNAEPIETGVLQRVMDHGSVTQGGKRINFSPISGGYIFWKDDITRLLEINEALEGTREELLSCGSLLEEENKQKMRRQKLIEQKSLYETIRRKTEPQQKLLSHLSQKLQESTDIEQARLLLSRITVIGAYVKRRSNLCLLASKADKIPLSEVELCIKELLTYLRIAGITAAYRLEIAEKIPCEAAERLYDFFESVVELSVDTLKTVTVSAEEENSTVTLNIVLNCDTNMDMLKACYPECDVEYDGDVWFCSLIISGGEHQ